MSKRMPYVQKALQSRIYGEDPSIDLNNPDLFQGPAGGQLQKRNNGDNNVQVNIFGRRWLIPNSYFLRNSVYDYEN